MTDKRWIAVVGSAVDAGGDEHTIDVEIEGGECFAVLQEKLHEYNARTVLEYDDNKIFDEYEYDKAMYDLAQAYILWWERYAKDWYKNNREPFKNLY
jgi:hypothetical protein